MVAAIGGLFLRWHGGNGTPEQSDPSNVGFFVRWLWLGMPHRYSLRVNLDVRDGVEGEKSWCFIEVFPPKYGFCYEK